MQLSGPGLSELMVSCRSMPAMHSYMHDTIIKDLIHSFSISTQCQSVLVKNCQTVKTVHIFVHNNTTCADLRTSARAKIGLHKMIIFNIICRSFSRLIA